MKKQILLSVILVLLSLIMLAVMEGLAVYELIDRFWYLYGHVMFIASAILFIVKLTIDYRSYLKYYK